VRALRSEDITFMVGPIGLWSHGEITAGFLVFCVPSVPKAFQNSLVSRMLSSFKGSRKSSNPDIHSRQGLPSWYRAKVSRKPRHTDISTMGEFTMLTARNDDETKGPSASEQSVWVEDKTGGSHPPVVHTRRHGSI
jgi:hypothetical protein